MSWVATAIVGGAVIGAGGSYLSSKNASDKAGNIAATTERQQEAMYLDQQSAFAPYKELGESALPSYYAMLGIDTPKLTDYEKVILDKYNAAGGENARARLGDKAFKKAVFGDYSNNKMALNTLETALRKTQLANSVGTLNKKGGELSPLALWQQQEFLKSQNRQDAARGLAGSGGASARIAEGNSAIAANDYQAQYQRILDALKIGTGASGAAGNSASQYSSQIGQNGANQMNLAIDQGNTQAQLWQGLGSLPMDYLSFKSLYGGSGGGSAGNLTTPNTSITPAATSTSRFGDISF